MRAEEFVDVGAASTNGAGDFQYREPGPRVYSIADLKALPEPTWHIEDVLPRGGFGVLYGPSGVGKSFLGLDWATCIAAGVSWYGKATKQGAVLYIAAEGASGLYQRVEAWLTERRQEPPELIRFLPTAVNLIEESGLLTVRAAIASMPVPPALVVVDTVARCMVGGDENSARDMGRFIAAIDELGHACGATRLAIHHTGKDGDDERGSSALRGAADTMLALKPDGSSLRLTCTKQKDAAECDAWTLHLESVARSCVLRLGTSPGALSRNERTVLSSTADAFGTTWVSPSTLLGELGIPRNSFFTTLKSLVERGFLEHEGGRGRSRYRLTADGESWSSTEKYRTAAGTESRSSTGSPPYRDSGTTDPDAEMARIIEKFGPGGVNSDGEATPI